MDVLEKQGADVVKSFDTPDWSPDKAQQEMEQSITSLGNDGFDAVYVANDGMAGGAIAALKGGGIEPATRFVTGQDAELAGIQRILSGEQLMTVYQPIIQIAETAAELAVPIAQGKTPPADAAPEKVDNGAKQVPSALLDTIAIQKDNIDSTVVKDGFLDVGGDLHRRVRPGLQEGRTAVTPAALAVDAGQTEIRAALDNGRGPRTATRAGGAAPGRRRRARRRGRRAAGRGGGPGPAALAAAGGRDRALRVRGRERGGPAAGERSAARPSSASSGWRSPATGSRRFWARSATRSGAVVAAGTGAVCVARRGERMAKVDGWGSLLGDAGSGFAIGRAGLDAALRAADGRGEQTALLAAAERRFGRLPQLAERVYGAPVPTRAIAGFAADVAGRPRRATRGAADPARGGGGAGALGRARRSGGCSSPARRPRSPTPATSSWPAPRCSSRSSGRVRERRPAAGWCLPQGDSLAGAALLAGAG